MFRADALRVRRPMCKVGPHLYRQLAAMFLRRVKNNFNTGKAPHPQAHGAALGSECSAIMEPLGPSTALPSLPRAIDKC